MKYVPEFETDVILDEIVDFGVTFRKIRKQYPLNKFICLDLNTKHFHLKEKPYRWVREVEKFIVYPWEGSLEDKRKLVLESLNIKNIPRERLYAGQSITFEL